MLPTICRRSQFKLFRNSWHINFAICSIRCLWYQIEMKKNRQLCSHVFTNFACFVTLFLLNEWRFITCYFPIGGACCMKPRLNLSSIWRNFEITDEKKFRLVQGEKHPLFKRRLVFRLLYSERTIEALNLSGKIYREHGDYAT